MKLGKEKYETHGMITESSVELNKGMDKLKALMAKLDSNSNSKLGMMQNLV
jgi:hypothetical protein